MKNILFVTWDGPQVSYLESLFLPIFRALQKHGFQFHILQFSWASHSVTEQRRDYCEAIGCTYTLVPVIRKPVALGGLITAIWGYRQIRQAIQRYDIDIVMPRSTLPAMSSLLALRGYDQKFVFDADGLPLDERVDFAGQSSSSIVHRILRDIEAQAVRSADVVLTRSKIAAGVLHARAGAGVDIGKFNVVSNGRDTSLFSPGSDFDRKEVKKKLGISEDAPLIVYAGSLGPQYCPDDMLTLFALIRHSRVDAHFLVLTGSPEVMLEQKDNYPELFSAITVMRVNASDVPSWLAAADLGIAFREAAFSMQGVAPIKLGEYLLCGVPVVATRGVGDSHYIDDKSGFLVDTGDKSKLESVSEWFVGKVLPEREVFRSHSRSIGKQFFSLESSVESYREALLFDKEMP